MSSNRINFVNYDKPISIRGGNLRGDPNAPSYSAYQLEDDGLYNLSGAPIADDDEFSFSNPSFCKKNYKILRVLLTNSGELRFGREGGASTAIPSHGYMTRGSRTCLFAGNIVITPENEICKISNKSGIFKCTPNSLQFIIASLKILADKHSNVKLADEIHIEVLDDRSSVNYIYSREEFKTLAEQFIAHYKQRNAFMDKDNFMFNYDQDRIKQWKELDQQPSTGKKAKIERPTTPVSRDGKQLFSLFDECSSPEESKENIATMPVVSNRIPNNNHPRSTSIKKSLFGNSMTMFPLVVNRVNSEPLRELPVEIRRNLFSLSSNQS